MIRYLLHRVRRHDATVNLHGFLHVYHCWTCSRNWNGLLLRGGKPWAV